MTRAILALSLAVALLAATASTASAERDPTAALTGNGVTNPTPAPPPLTLDLRVAELGGAFPRKKLKFVATTNNNAVLEARGSKIKKTAKQLYAGDESKMKVRLKHKKQLVAQDGEKNPKVKIKFAATDIFGQTATDVIKLQILVRSGGGVIVIEQLS